MRFIYTGEIQTSIEEMLELWRVADQFDIKTLLEEALKLLNEYDYNLGTLPSFSSHLRLNRLLFRNRNQGSFERTP